MFGFGSKASKEDIEKYGVMLANMALTNNLGIQSVKDLYDFATSQKFTAEQIAEAQELACRTTWSAIIQDYVLTDEERQSFEKLLGMCTGLKDSDRQRWLDKTELHNTLYTLEYKGILPVYSQSEVNVIFKPNEILHYASYSYMMKKKRVTKRVNYSGPVASIRICKGVRYRIGSVQVSRQVEEFWDYEDKGIFWVTNQRIGYIGNTKSFSFPLDKLLSLNTGDGGLNIFKNGRTNPFVIYLDDYELPCAVISKLLND